MFKKFLVVLAALMLIANAGLDLGRYRAKYKAEQAALKALVANFDVEGGGGIKPKVNACFPINGLGWICDFSLTGPNGESARGSHFFTYEDLAQ